MSSKAPGRVTTGDAPLLKAVDLQRRGQWQEAEAAYRAILKKRPRHEAALMNCGALLRRAGRSADARQMLEYGVTHHTRSAGMWGNLTNVLVDLGDWQAAVAAGQKATELAPGSATNWNNLGNALFNQNRFDLALQACRRALELDPSMSLAWNNLGNVHLRQCRVEEAVECYRRAFELEPHNAMARSNELFALHFSARYTPQEIAQAHRQWGLSHEAPLKPRALTPRPAVDMNTGSAARRLRVGMISADLRAHPVADFLRPLVRHWPAELFDLHFYSTHTRRDDVTQWFASACRKWRDVAGLSHEELARCIHADEVDVLFEITGHTAGNRLLTLAYRPAPVQVSWLGYFDTTGMTSVDFLLCDVMCMQQGEENRYTERVVRLPDDFLCYEPPADAPEVAPLPALGRGTVTFGSQNQIVKVQPEVVRCWAEIVNAVPGSRLLLAGKAFNDQSTRQNYRQQFADAGLASDRLDLRAGNSKAGVLATYGEIDIALDPFPCAGGTTTCEALWMGVPVVTLYGERFGGRHSASHLRAVGIPGLIARDLSAYRDLALKLAADLAGLAQLRRGLRERMRASAMCDGPRFARNFTAAVQVMWRQACLRDAARPSNQSPCT